MRRSADARSRPDALSPASMQASAFVYGQDVLYAARGREARSRPDAALPPASMPAHSPAGERAPGVARTRLVCKISDLRHRRVIRLWGGTSLCRMHL